MYMPLEVPLGELAVAPVNPVHEEVVRELVFFVGFPLLFSIRSTENKTHHSIFHFPSFSLQNPIQITVARFSHDEELLWTGASLEIV